MRNRFTADEWNAMYPVGTPVTAYPGFMPSDLTNPGPGIPVLTTRTRTRAWLIGDEPVVSVDDYAGGISLDHVFPRPTI